MKNKMLIICIFILSFFLSFSQLSKTFSSHAKIAEDYITTTLPQSIPIKTLQGSKLLANDKITQSFIARYDNLGTIAIRFNKPKGYTDTIFFRIKESQSDTWAYEQTYQAHTFDASQYFTFGFPPIANSRNRQYTIELESLKGTANTSLSFHPSSDIVIAKFSYPKSYLFTHTGKILPFLKERISIYLTYMPLTDLLYALFLFSLPFLTVKFLSVFWRISKQLEKSKRFFVYANSIAPFTLFIITIVIYGYFSSIGANAHHDGAMFKPAFDVASGLMLFRDTFYQYGAFTALLQASALLIFGKYLITIKFLTVFFYGLICLSQYLLFKKLLPTLLLITMLLLWMFTSPHFIYMSYNWTTAWSSVYAILFQILTAYFIIRALETKRSRFIVLGGIATSLTFWCRQPVGIFLFFAITGFYILLYLLKSISKNALMSALKIFVFVNAGVSLIFLFWIGANHALNDWWRQSIMFAFSLGQSRGSGYGILPIFQALFAPSKNVLSIWTLMPITTLVLFIRYSCRLTAKKDMLRSKIILLLCAISLSSWPQYYPYNDPAHAFWGATPMYGLFAFGIFDLVRHFILWKDKTKMLVIKYVTIGILVAIFIPDISFRLQDGLKKIRQTYIYVDQPQVLRSIRLTIEEAEYYTYVYNAIETYLQKNSMGNVVDVSPDSLYLTFDSRIKNFQPVYMNWDTLNNSEYPEYNPNKDTYIKIYKPFLISYFEFLPEEYCRIDSYVRSDSMFLAAPCDLTAK
jgi:hypothetical protein